MKHNLPPDHKEIQSSLTGYGACAYIRQAELK